MAIRTVPLVTVNLELSVRYGPQVRYFSNIIYIYASKAWNRVTYIATDIRIGLRHEDVGQNQGCRIFLGTKY
jgi:hypothetical protein